MPAPNFAFPDPDAALDAISGCLLTTDVEHAVAEYPDRILAQDVLADRDSPAADVSAMDGYAIRLSDLEQSGDIAVVGESACGSAPPPMPETGVLRIFTGAIVPVGCEAVIKREDTHERADAIAFLPSARQVAAGANIRRAGENLRGGSPVFEAGTLLTAAACASLVNFGCYQADLYRRVRVSILTTGDEVIGADQTPQPWQLRNSNLHCLRALFCQRNWIQMVRCESCQDDQAKLKSRLRESLEDCDAVVLTGGVSKGDYDYVSDVIRGVGGNVIFHGLPIRPGKPILGAVTDNGKLIMGLPGNPVSAMVNARRMVLPLLAKMSGQTHWNPKPPKLDVSGLRPRTLPLHLMLLAQTNAVGQCEIVPSKGSGDLVALGRSDGFVEVPIGATADQPRRFYRW